MPAQPARVRKRILAPLVLALAILEALFIFSLHRQQEEQLHQRLDREVQAAARTLESVLSRQGKLLTLALEGLARDPELARAFIAREREALLRRADQLLPAMRREHGLTQIVFCDKERRVFLRAHDPGLSGDRPRRRVLEQAQGQDKTSVAMELGPRGLLSQRAAAPWVVDGEVIGLLETGTEIKGIVEELGRLLGLDFLVLLDKGLLERADWEAGLALLGRPWRWDLYPETVVMHSTLPEPPRGLAGHLPEDRHRHLVSLATLEAGGRIYRAGFVPLLDAGGGRLGDLAALSDVTDLIRRDRAAILVTVLVGLAAGLALTLLFSAFLGRLERLLAQAQDRVEEALRESEHRYRHLFESAHDGVLIMGGDAFLDCNARIPELFGCARQDILGRPPWDFSPPLQPDGQPSPEKARASIAAALEGEPQFFQWRHARPDGGQFDAEISLTRLEMGGQPHLLAIVRDITERLAAEAALKASEEKLFKAFRKSPLWVAISTLEEGTYLDVNDTYCMMTGFTREEALGRTSLELSLWVDPEDRRRALRQIERHGSLREYPIAFRRKSGEVRQGLWSVEVIELGGQECLIGVMTDITDALTAQEALLVSEERYRLLTDHSLTGVYIHQGGRFTYANQRLADIMGHTVEEVLQRNFWEFVHPEDRGLVRERGMARSRGEPVSPANYDFRVLRPDGSLRWLEVLATTIHLANGPANIGNVMDITERKQAEDERREAEEALRKSEGRYRALLEASPDPMVVYDMEGRVTFLNRAFTRVFGWTREERLGSRLDDFVPEVAWPETREMIAKALAGEGFSGVETRRLTKAGEIIPVSVSGAVFPGPDGQPLGSVSIIRDIRDAKRLQSELFQAKKMEVIGTLASGIAHDFNNILAAVVGHAERALHMAQNRKDNSPQIQQILRAAERAGNLVRQILAFSRKEAVEPKPLDLNRQVEQAVQLLSHTIPKMIRVETSLASDLRLVSADAGQMDQVLLNLATNAVDAMPSGGRLLFETANVTLEEEDCRGRLDLQPGQYVQLIVSDTGHGMDENTRQHIFDPFFTTKEVGKGTGLGLSTVYGVVKSLGGHISCYSEPGLGTAIKINLPPCDERPAPFKIIAPQAAPGGHERVLLVDDEEGLREMAAQSLREAGYEVVTAASGEEALEIYMVRGERLDLVVLDLGMPGMGGQRCLERLLAINPKAKVLIASGYSANGQVRDSLRAGAADFVAKPFRLAQFLTKVRQVLDRR